MGMSLQTSDDYEDHVVSDINTTPLVDVMLVLLIIFLITIPVVTSSISVELPKERNVPTQTKPENVILAVDRDGQVYWNTLKIANQNDLVERLKKVSVLDPQPEVHIRGDLNVRFESIGRVVVAAQRAGILRLGFITEPAGPTN
ncbi:MAG: biopolymer transporter ExbD [Burkholderiaceae bacterium]|nr:biopolymer transporter ExbD [Burkholderiaceae bacterium]